MQKIRVGCIGCGGFATGYLHPCLKFIPAFDLVCVCDIDALRAERNAKMFRAKSWYTDWREIFDKEELDAVVIATPPTVHEEAGLEVLRRGLHLFCEKPTAMTT